MKFGESDGKTMHNDAREKKTAYSHACSISDIQRIISGFFIIRALFSVFEVFEISVQCRFRKNKWEGQVAVVVLPALGHATTNRQPVSGSERNRAI
jgi:hypothetical protein